MSNTGAQGRELSSPSRTETAVGADRGSWALVKEFVSAQQRKCRKYNAVENSHTYDSGQTVKSCSLGKFPHKQIGIWDFQLILEGTQVLHMEQLGKTPYIKSILGVNCINKNSGFPVTFFY